MPIINYINIIDKDIWTTQALILCLILTYFNLMFNTMAVRINQDLNNLDTNKIPITKLLYFLYLHFNSSPKILVWYMHNKNPKSRMCVCNKNEKSVRNSEIVFESLRHRGEYETLSGRKRVRVKTWVWAWKRVIETRVRVEGRGWKGERCEWAHEKGYMREYRKTCKRMRKWEETGDGWEVWEIICEK